MTSPYRYVMRDQVQGRVAAIMAHRLRAFERPPTPLRGGSRWLALLALAAYSAAVSFVRVRPG